MAISTNLNKLFVRIPTGTTGNFAEISQAAGNTKKIFFHEGTKEIWVNGVAYGLNTNMADAISYLQNWVGSSADKGNDVSTIIERLTSLEAIKSLDSNYLTVGKDNTDNAPTLDLNVVPIATVTSGANTGLVDALEAKGYIDDKAAAAKTVVVEGKGVKVTPDATAADGHTEYTVDASLLMAYNAASGADGATITLTDGKGNTFGTVNVSDIIGNGVLDHSSYNPNTGILTLSFKQADGTTQDEQVDLKAMLDINDMSINNDSSKYLAVALDSTAAEDGKAQAVFQALIVDPSTATASNTGLADAYEVKQYVDSKTTDLAVTAQGDTYYIGAAQDANDKKKIDVSALLSTVTGPANGTDANPALSGTQGLLDGQDLSKVKNYVDSTVYNLNATEATTGTNVSVGVVETAGKITAVTVEEKYATVTASGSGLESTYAVTDGTQLVVGNDLTTVKTVYDAKIAALDASIKALDSALDAAIEALDSSVEASDSKNFIKYKVTEEDGLLSAATITTTYGNFNNAATVSGASRSITDGIATVEDVVNFVDTYDYWETYSA